MHLLYGNFSSCPAPLSKESHKLPLCAPTECGPVHGITPSPGVHGPPQSPLSQHRADRGRDSVHSPLTLLGFPRCWTHTTHRPRLADSWIPVRHSWPPGSAPVTSDSAPSSLEAGVSHFCCLASEACILFFLSSSSLPFSRHFSHPSQHAEKDFKTFCFSIKVSHF